MSRGVSHQREEELFFKGQGSLDTLEKPMHGLQQRLDGKAKSQVIQAVLTATNRHLVFYDLDQLAKVNGRQRQESK